jgi:hypothetical protein
MDMNMDKLQWLKERQKLSCCISRGQKLIIKEILRYDGALKKIYRNKINNKDILDEISPRFLTEPGTKEGTFSDKRPLENRDIENRDLELRNIENREKDTKDNLTSLSVSLLKDFEDRTGT